MGFMVLGCAVFSPSIGVVYAGRILSSLANGAATPSSQIYISECSSPRIRGALGSITALWLALGILIAYVVGAFLPWYALAWVESGFPILLLIGMLFMPETPGWLLSKGRKDDAQNSLQKLRGRHTDVTLELQRIEDTITNGAEKQQQMPTLFNKPVLVPFGLTLALMWFQQFSGVNAVLFYTVSIFDEAGGSVNRHLATIIVGLVQFLSTILSIILIDKAGRRILLLISAFIMAFAQASLGSFFYIKETRGQEAASAIGWLPLTSLVIFIAAFSIGFNNIPFLIMGEILPSRFRALLGPLSSSFNLIMTFTVVRTFPIMADSVGKYGVFWFYMACCIVAVFFVYFCLPETKGKSLEEIEKMFGGGLACQDMENPKPIAEVERAPRLILGRYDSEDEDEDDGRLAPTIA
ncbi:hypothetical protein QYM36_016570 [Artemia franciscana]|nr:hypothetical protein QYM36_016570 [Artemia franciscana]